MKFAEFHRYVSEISAFEFKERDAKLTKGILRVKQEMSSRGVLLSTMTHKKFSELLLAEYEARSDYLARLVSEGVGRIVFEPTEDIATLAKSLFYSLSSEQADVITEHYTAASQQTRDTLLSSEMTEEIDNLLHEGMESRLLKNNLHIEYTFKSAESVNKNNRSIWMLTPNFYGIGMDLPALFQRIFQQK